MRARLLVAGRDAGQAGAPQRVQDAAAIVVELTPELGRILLLAERVRGHDRHLQAAQALPVVAHDVVLASPQELAVGRRGREDAEEGRLYMGTVKKIMDFGAFVEILPGTDGLVHISELDTARVKVVTDVLNEGDKVLVKCIGVDKNGKIKLSRKEALGLNLDGTPVETEKSAE